MDSIFLAEKNELISDVREFCNSEEEYVDYGIPYKRNYLFYGPPGTGKTSTITAIASEFNFGICLLNFGTDLEDNEFIRLMSRIPENYILVLEDIDSLFIDNRTQGKNSLVSFSTLLNTLDGIARRQKLITFMTTNFKDKLDSALMRPGRVDKIIEFKPCVEEQIRDMFQHYRPGMDKQDELTEFTRKCARIQNITTSCLQKFLFETRKEETILDKMDVLRSIIEDHKPESKQSKYGMMYQ
jgi:chaperone BCS1